MVKTKDNSNLDAKYEHFKFEKLDIGEESDWEWDNGHQERLTKAELCAEVTLAQKTVVLIRSENKYNKKKNHYTPALWGKIRGRLVETSRDSYVGRNPLPKLRTHKPTRMTRVLQTVVA